jgi:pyridinium-3,5-biscarboxylic acid mononucleotide sulfurtransferase
MNLPPATLGKYNELLRILSAMKKVLVAFSGGVDSTLLVHAAVQACGPDNVLAVTANSQTYAKRELDESRSLAAEYSFRHRIIMTDEVETINAAGNTLERCYHCKTELFTRLTRIAREEGFDFVAEGSNADDRKDFRPGFRAIRELSIRSPLLEAGLAKDEIRLISRELGLPTFAKPPVACFTSRFPYNVRIEEAALKRIEEAENYLHDLGYALCRVRHYGDRARVEVDKALLPMALAQAGKIIARLKELGYAEVEIDLEGYRMGSMNIPFRKAESTQ